MSNAYRFITCQSSMRHRSSSLLIVLFWIQKYRTPQHGTVRSPSLLHRRARELSLVHTIVRVLLLCHIHCPLGVFTLPRAP